MSHNCHSEIRKNVAYIGYHALLKAAHDAQDSESGDSYTSMPPLKVGSWAGLEHSTQKSDIITHKLKCGKRVVHLLNMSPFNHVGEFEWMVFGESAADVRAFLKDIGVKATIKKQDAVQYWW